MIFDDKPVGLTIIGVVSRIKTDVTKARIKKIMQMDEDVGKLASATPVMICERANRGLDLDLTTSAKSLECFLQSLMDQTAETARQRGSRKITAYHLYVPLLPPRASHSIPCYRIGDAWQLLTFPRKQTINASPSFDFLQEVVASVPDPVATAEDGPGPSTASKRERQNPDDEFSPYGGQGPRGRKQSTWDASGGDAPKKRGRRKAGAGPDADFDDVKPVFEADAGPGPSGSKGFSGAGGRDIMGSSDDAAADFPPPQAAPPPAAAAALPDVGTWHRDASGGGGRGEGGRGMFDDYEEDEDDY